MRFIETHIQGLWTVELEPRMDERGMFARAFCEREFQAHGLETSYVQANMSVNRYAGTVRGLHFQREPHAEVKLVRCVVGCVYDVVVDIREDSRTHLQWFGAELSQDNGLMMYVPRGFAHGYQALTDGATVHYMVSTHYAPHAEGGLRYDDPSIGVTWPRPVSNVSPKDAAWPLLHKNGGKQ